MDDEEDLTEEQLADLAKIEKRKKAIVTEHRMKKTSANNQAMLPRRKEAEGKLTAENMKVRLGGVGQGEEGQWKEGRGGKVIEEGRGSSQDMLLCEKEAEGKLTAVNMMVRPCACAGEQESLGAMSADTRRVAHTCTCFHSSFVALCA